MLNNRSLVSKYLTWDLGNGEEALFWEDSWNGNPPLINSNFSPETITKLKSLWGTKVKDYVEESESEPELGKEWKWKSISKHDIDLEERNKSELLLKS